MLLALLFACFHAPVPEVPFEDRVIDAAGMARAFPIERVKDRAGWATDLHAVLSGHEIPATNRNTCMAVATTEQESGFSPDPAVPGIGRMIDGWIAEKHAELGKTKGWAFETGLRAVLDTTGPGAKTSYYERLRAAKTERDVDRVYRELVDAQRARIPRPLRAAESAAKIVGLDLDGMNPITTAGCLQVKVDFAEEHARVHGTDRALVRDALYTRQGCLHYGVVRLLDWDVGYDAPRYRFADYNAGVYASRNAAFQSQVAAVWGKPLALDGDLVRYDGARSRTEDAVTQVLGTSEWAVTRDLKKGKLRSFEDTDAWREIRARYRAKTGREPAYARLPDVHLDSIKLSGDKTTAWFAESVDRRYQRCIERLAGGD